ncbi:MAG: hypothetical protein PHI20_06535 [Endomicrobiaceae bacterium]|jgi:hypothetical protein|nr:hypothetical protein [Endomicrobiaceae bacterium]MDD3730675.1 hypothetical protein [Endomicrobiaceae bacterium]MDD4165615.1 hypothetical protein [Endomicrobiaceae bacterium]
MLFEIFEFAGIAGFIFICLAVFFAVRKKFKLHRLFAIAGFTAVIVHASIYFIFLK